MVWFIFENFGQRSQEKPKLQGFFAKNDKIFKKMKLTKKWENYIHKTLQNCEGGTILIMIFTTNINVSCVLRCGLKLLPIMNESGNPSLHTPCAIHPNVCLLFLSKCSSKQERWWLKWYRSIDQLAVRRSDIVSHT